jgi:hypothetical protein
MPIRWPPAQPLEGQAVGPVNSNRFACKAGAGRNSDAGLPGAGLLGALASTGAVVEFAEMGWAGPMPSKEAAIMKTNNHCLAACMKPSKNMLVK